VTRQTAIIRQIDCASLRPLQEQIKKMKTRPLEDLDLDRGREPATALSQSGKDEPGPEL